MPCAFRFPWSIGCCLGYSIRPRRTPTNVLGDASALDPGLEAGRLGRPAMPPPRSCARRPKHYLTTASTGGAGVYLITDGRADAHTADEVLDQGGLSGSVSSRAP